MKKYLPAIISTFLLISLNAFAAGGGGGGGGGGVTAPAPDPAPAQEIITPATTPDLAVCSEDTWNCGEWSACQMDGRQRRTCSIANECSAAETPKPTELQICPGLKCGQLPSLKARVQCRLGLKPEELKAEFSILYFPEYCKVEESEEEKIECVGLYQAFQPCWALPIGAERLACGMKVSGIQKSPKNDRAQCLKKSSTSRQACLKEVKESTEAYLLFQMYEYEFQAEDLLKLGNATLAQVTDFDVFVEKNKRKVEESEDVKVWEKLLKKIAKKFKVEFFHTPAK